MPPAQERGPIGPSRKIVNPEVSTHRARYMRIDARRAPWRQTKFVEKRFPPKPDILPKTHPSYWTEKLGQLRKNPRYTPKQADIFVANTFARITRQSEKAQKKANKATKEAQKAKRSSERDPLTDLYNRKGIDRRFAEALSRSERTGEKVSIAMMDLDKFKDINDTYGHGCGDDVLRFTANHLRNTGRNHDIFGRMGGEEIIGILPGENIGRAVRAMERQRIHLPESVDRELTKKGEFKVKRDITMSVGIATFDPKTYQEKFGTRPEQLRRILLRKYKNLSELEKMDHKDRTEILRDAEKTRKQTIFDYLTKKADRAMYEAKELGRDKVVAAMEDKDGKDMFVEGRAMPSVYPIYDRMSA